MARTIVHLLGTSWCGSSLLNALVDGQPSARGLGEACHWLERRTDAWCTVCQKPATDCPVRELRHSPNFWTALFGLYPDTTVLFHTSKSPTLCFERLPKAPEGVRELRLLLFKYPHEYAQSYLGHPMPKHARTVEAAVEYWLRFHEWVQQYMNFYQWDFDCLSYRELATDPAGTLSRLCQNWSIPFDRDATVHPWGRSKLPPTHTIGGNNAIFAQRTCNSEFFADRAYLDGKYVGKMGSIFLDESWRTNDDLVSCCRSVYTSPASSARMERVARDLRYAPGIAGFLADLTAPRGDAPRVGAS